MPMTDSPVKTSEPTPHEIIRALPERRRKPRRRWYVLLVVVLAALVLWLYLSHNAAGPRPGGAAVPVAVAKAVLGDIPVYLDGLGSVAAFYTVNLHSRVDGQLVSVAIKEGQYVKAGDLLAQIDPRPFQAQLDSAQGQLDKDQALLANARLDLERYRTLAAEKAVPRQQYDTQAATVGQYEGIVKTDMGAVESARLQLAYSRITSPIPGRVGLSQVDPGNIVHAADTTPLFVITQLHPIAVVFTLPEDSLPPVMQKLRAGGRLPVEAYNRDKTLKLGTGALLTADNEIDPNSGTAKLKAIFDNRGEALFPNQFVNIRLLLETRRGQVIVPSAAVQRSSKGDYVYVNRPDNTVELRLVKTGIVEGDSTSLDSGVKADESVVTDGADKLQPGSAVTLSGAATGAPGATAPGKGKRRGK